MRSPLVTTVFITCFLAASAFGRSYRTHFYRVHVKNEDEYSRAYSLAHTVVLSKSGEYVDIVAPPRAAENLRKEGVEVELIQKDMVSRFHQVRRKRNLGEYHTHEEIVQKLNRHRLQRDLLAGA